MKKLKRNIILLSILTLGILFYVMKDDFNGITKVLFSSNLWYISLVLIALCIGDLFKSLSIWSIIKETNKDYKFIRAYLLILKTNFFNGITPFALGGQPFQLYTLKNNDNIDYSTGVNILFKDYYAYEFAFLSLATIMLIINYAFKIVFIPDIMNKFLFIGYLMVLGVSMFLVFVSRKKTNNTKGIDLIINFLNKIKIIRKKEEFLNKTHESIKRIRTQIKNNNKKIMLRCYLYNLVKILSLGVAAYFCFGATSVGGVSILSAVIIIVFIMVLSTFVPIPGASGGMEFGFATLFASYVIGAKLNATLIIWRFTGFHILVIVGALVFIIQERRRIRREDENEQINNG